MRVVPLLNVWSKRHRKVLKTSVHSLAKQITVFRDDDARVKPRRSTELTWKLEVPQTKYYDRICGNFPEWSPNSTAQQERTSMAEEDPPIDTGTPLGDSCIASTEPMGTESMEKPQDPPVEAVSDNESHAGDSDSPMSRSDPPPPSTSSEGEKEGSDSMEPVGMLPSTVSTMQVDESSASSEQNAGNDDSEEDSSDGVLPAERSRLLGVLSRLSSSAHMNQPTTSEPRGVVCFDDEDREGSVGRPEPSAESPPAAASPIPPAPSTILGAGAVADEESTPQSAATSLLPESKKKKHFILSEDLTDIIKSDKPLAEGEAPPVVPFSFFGGNSDAPEESSHVQSSVPGGTSTHPAEKKAGDSTMAIALPGKIARPKFFLGVKSTGMRCVPSL